MGKMIKTLSASLLVTKKEQFKVMKETENFHALEIQTFQKYVVSAPPNNSTLNFENSIKMFDPQFLYNFGIWRQRI